MINLKKLLTENVVQKPRLTESDHVHNGLQKVFSAGDAEISYRRCENVGLGYIKSISEAVKIAIQESRKVAKTFGYRDDVDNAKFIKEDGEMSDFDRGEYENGRPPVSTKTKKPTDYVCPKCGEEKCSHCLPPEQRGTLKNKYTENNFSKLDAQSPESAMAKMSPEELPHDEADMSNPEESREVKIGHEILLLTVDLRLAIEGDSESQNAVTRIQALAKELISMHGQSPQVSQQD